jgi:hypothetical protein
MIHLPRRRCQDQVSMHFWCKCRECRVHSSGGRPHRAFLHVLSPRATGAVSTSDPTPAIWNLRACNLASFDAPRWLEAPLAAGAAGGLRRAMSCRTVFPSGRLIGITPWGGCAPLRRSTLLQS